VTEAPIVIEVTIAPDEFFIAVVIAGVAFWTVNGSHVLLSLLLLASPL
jgi:hypothetical protein